MQNRGISTSSLQFTSLSIAPRLKVIFSKRLKSIQAEVSTGSIIVNTSSKSLLCLMCLSLALCLPNTTSDWCAKLIIC